MWVGPARRSPRRYQAPSLEGLRRTPCESEVRSTVAKEALMATGTLPNVLVTTDWVAQHATDAGVRVVEVDTDTTAYDQGHVPGAVGWNWTTELCDTLVRDIAPTKKLEELLGR